MLISGQAGPVRLDLRSIRPLVYSGFGQSVSAAVGFLRFSRELGTKTR
jgi:hypothetical protein